MVFIFPSSTFSDEEVAKRKQREQAEIDRINRTGAVQQRRGLMQEGGQIPPTPSTRPRGLPGFYELPNDPTATSAGSTQAYADFQQGRPPVPFSEVGPLNPPPPQPKPPQTPLPSLPKAPTQVAPPPLPGAPAETQSVLKQPPPVEQGPTQTAQKPPDMTYPSRWDDYAEQPEQGPALPPESREAPQYPEKWDTYADLADNPPEPEATPYKQRISTVTNAEGQYVGGVRVPDPGELKAARESGDLGAIGRAYGINPEDYEDPRAFRNDVLEAEKEYATRSRNWNVVPDGMGGFTWVLNENGRKLQEDQKRRSFLRRMSERFGSGGTGNDNTTNYDQLAEAYDSAEGDHGDRAGAVNASVLDPIRAQQMADRRQNVRTRAEQDEMARRMGVPVGHVIAAQTMMNAQSPTEMAQAMFAMDAVYPGYGFGERGAYLMDMVASGQSDQALAAMEMQRAWMNNQTQLGVAQMNQGTQMGLGQMEYNLGLNQLQSNDYATRMGLEGQRVTAAGQAAQAQAQAGQPLTPQQQAELEATNPVVGYQNSVRRSTYTEGGLTEMIAYANRLSTDDRGNPTANNAGLMIMNGIKSSSGWQQCQADINEGRIANVPPQWFDTMASAHSESVMQQGESIANMDPEEIRALYQDFVSKYGLKDSDSLQQRWAQSAGVDVTNLNEPRSWWSGMWRDEQPTTPSPGV